MQNEIELKLRIDTRDILRLRRHPAIRQRLNVEPLTRRLVSTYYDTPELTLLKQAISLRVRRMSGGWFQAVKGSGHALAGLHQRFEWEDIIARGAPDFTKITEPFLARIFADQALRAALQSVFVTDVQRTEWQLTYEDGTELEVALDLGLLKANGQTEPITEVEIELKKGEAFHLFELAVALQKTIPLQIENMSKAERGYRHYRSPKNTIKPSKPLKLPKKTDTHEGFQAVVLDCLQQLQNHQVAAANDGIEATHQMHITLRRLKIAFKLFGQHHEPLAAELEWLNALIGETRNWDVLMDETLPQALGASSAYEALLSGAKRRKTACRKKLQAALASQRYQALLLQLGLLATRKSQENKKPLGKWLRQRLRKLTGSLPWQQQRLSDLKPAELHRTRIRIKRLRYGQCFFGAASYQLLPARHLINLQKQLGRLNDMHVGKQLIQRLLARLPPADRQDIRDIFSLWQSKTAEKAGAQMEASWAKLQKHR